MDTPLLQPPLNPSATPRGGATSDAVSIPSPDYERPRGDTPPRVIYVVNRVPWPLDDGWKRRTFAVLQGMATQSLVYLVAPEPAGDIDLDEFRRRAGTNVQLELASAESPGSLVGSAWRTIFSTESPLSIRHNSRALEQTVIATAIRTRPALVLYAGAFLAERHTRSALASVPFIVDTHNIDSHAIRRRAPSERFLLSLATRWVSRRLRRAEARVFSEACATLVCSVDEVPLVMERAADARPFVVPNGVDTSVFAAAAPKAPQKRLELLFFGNLDYPPNVDAMQFFAREIYPVLQARDILFNLTVVGAGRGDRVRELLAPLANVTVAGLSNDIVQTLHDADVVLVPLRAGGGTRLKVLEALSSGRLVISTRLGAEGIDVVDGVHAIFADSALDFATALAAVQANPARAAEIAAAGARLARSSYSWEAIQTRLGDIIRHHTPATPRDILQ